MHYFQGSREHRPPLGGGGGLRNILCYVSAEENSKIKPAFTKYALNTHGVLLPSMREMPGYEEFFFSKKNDTSSSK